MKWNRKRCELLTLVMMITFLPMIEPGTRAYAERIKSRVIATTHIQISRGDPDSRQSMSYILFFADKLDIW